MKNFLKYALICVLFIGLNDLAIGFLCNNYNLPTWDFGVRFWFVLIVLASIFLAVVFIDKDDAPKKYTLTYTVFFPGHPETFTVSNDVGYDYGATKGVNYIIGNDYSTIYKGTAPFKINSYKSEVVESN